MYPHVFFAITFSPLDLFARILYNARMEYINIRVRKETHYKLKLLAVLSQEQMLDTLDRLITQELDRMQKGHHDASEQKNQARGE